MNTSTLDGFQYFESDSVDNIRSLFFNFYENKNLPLLIQNSKIIRELFLNSYSPMTLKKNISY